MKISFEGTIEDIFNQMESMLAHYANLTREINEPVQEAIAPEVIAAVDDVPVDKPVDKPVEKPVEKPVDKMAKVRAARGKAKAKPAPVPQEPFSDPADIVKLRQRTINDLQEAYANGHQAEVFELLSRFGNGAKSFRELPADAFVPIREAIDSGALT